MNPYNRHNQRLGAHTEQTGRHMPVTANASQGFVMQLKFSTSPLEKSFLSQERDLEEPIYYQFNTLQNYGT